MGHAIVVFVDFQETRVCECIYFLHFFNITATQIGNILQQVVSSWSVFDARKIQSYLMVFFPTTVLGVHKHLHIKNS